MSNEVTVLITMIVAGLTCFVGLSRERDGGVMALLYFIGFLMCIFMCGMIVGSTWGNQCGL